ncbi:MAG: hypothetical protein KGQ59_11425 [Bdellovibrionales bacterium]|nr:hypothetical protein [Bdellovibrionales bacterium]
MKPSAMIIKYFALLSVFVITLSGCSSIRLRYEGEVKDSKGRVGTVSFEKSYDISGGIPVWCGLSAIYFGGACWYYLALPSVRQKKMCREDAQAAIEKKLKTTDFTLEENLVESISWKNKTETLDIEWN